MADIILDGECLTLADVLAVARNRARASVSPAAMALVERSRAVVDKLLESDVPVYGLNTGFGSLRDVRIDADQARQLQRNLVRSHCCGVGEAAPQDVARAMMLLRANTLVKGRSGVRPIVIDTLVQMLNESVYPVVPVKGSVGASGDLAPLAHLALALMGEGQAFDKANRRLSAAAALSNAGIKPLQLEAKEGLALTNGTQFMTAVGALAFLDAEYLAEVAIQSCCLSLEAMRGVLKAFDERLHDARNQRGQKRVAEIIRRITFGSEILALPTAAVQDDYCLRCAPQVIGAALDTLEHVRWILEAELNAATDNPLIFAPESDSPSEAECQNAVVSGGNFHGMPIAMALDQACIAVAAIANIAERRIFHLTTGRLSNGLPRFLTLNAGLQSGLMIAQVTAASLVSENKTLSHPACVDSIPTVEDAEDHVSMGAFAARKFAEVVRNATWVVAIELICAAQGIEFRKPAKPSPTNQALQREICKLCPGIAAEPQDRPLGPEIEAVAKVIGDRLFSNLITTARKNQSTK